MTIDRAWRAGLLFVVGVGMAAGSAAGDSEGRREARRPRPQAIRVGIDILPDDPDNLVDPTHPGKIEVAILGSAGFDPRSVEAGSLRLQGAAVLKGDDGSLATLRDIDADGRADLVALFSEAGLGGGTDYGGAVLSGTTVTGQRFEGSDRVATLDSRRLHPRAGGSASAALRKTAPVRVGIDVLPGDAANRLGSDESAPVPVAILSAPGFDATGVDPGSVELSGAPVTRARRGRFATETDVNGDGRTDLVVNMARQAVRLAATTGRQPVVLRAVTDDGRIVEGRDLVSAPLPRVATGAGEASAAIPFAPAATNPGAIVINDNAPATPYPSTINVPAGPPNQLISKVRVTLRQISHTFPLDLDILLVGPEGQSVVLMSDAGGGNPGIGATTLIFDDDARDYLPASSPPSGGVYRPTNYFTGPDPFPAPAPTPSSAAGLAVFNSTHPGGAWSLYVLDTAAGDVGTIAGGWSIEFVTMEQQCYSFGQGQDFFIEPTGRFFIYPVPLTFTAPGVASQVTLALRFDHDQAADMDVMVESPTGEKSIVLSDALGEGPSGVTTLRLDDDAAAIVPESPVGIGTFGSVNYDDGLTDVFAAPAPPGPYGYSLGALRGSGVAGTWNLYFMDDDPSLATNGFLFTACLGIVAVAPTNNVNNAAVTIPQGAPGTTAGPASPYPSTMLVSGVPGTIAAVTVDLFGLQHTFPDDLDLLLIGPGGQSVVLMSDAGGSVASAGVNLTFDDAAADPLPDGAPGLAPGRWRPSQYEPGTDAFPLPAPAGPYGTSLSNFEGTEPNGRWSLYVFDDALGDIGSIATGWRLNLTTILAPETFCTSTAIAIPAGAPGTTNGPASLYPGTVVVSGVDMPAGRVRVLIPGLSHTYPDDLDLMLVGPQGGRVILMSDAGGENAVNGISLIFDDRADGPPGDQTPLVSGTYRVSNYDSGDGDPLPPPAPSVPGTSSIASIAAGNDPNGIWSLYIFDDASGDTGVVDFGWCVEISPLFRPVEASSPVTGIYQLRFQTPTSMTWFDILSDSPVSSIEQYNLYRGDQTTQPALLNPDVDSCLRLTSPGFPITGLTDVPPVGSMYWYLLAGANFAGQPGSAGFARTGLGFEARVLDPMGSCP